MPCGPGVIQRGRGVRPTGSGPAATVVTAGPGPPGTGAHRPPGVVRLFQRPRVVAPGRPLRVVVVIGRDGLTALRAAAVAVAIAPVLALWPGPLPAAGTAGAGAGAGRGPPRCPLVPPAGVVGVG